jgi:hypothetical protein
MKKKRIRLFIIILILFVCIFILIKTTHKDLCTVYFYEINKNGENLKVVKDIGAEIRYIYPDDYSEIAVYLTNSQAYILRNNKRVKEVYKNVKTGPIVPDDPEY